MKLVPVKVSSAHLTKGLASAVMALFAVLFTIGCNGPANDAADGPFGSAAVAVSSLGAADVAGATVSITATDIAVPITAALSSSNGWHATIGGIPVGTARTFTLSATDINGVEQFHGTTNNVTITSGQTQSVVIVAQQTAQSAAFADAVPVIDLVQASSNNVAPGGVITLNVTAHDPDPGDVLTYSWAASSGTFSSSTAQSSTWTAPNTLGTYPITIAVRDSKQEVATATLPITVAAPAVQAPIPRYVTWLLAGLLAVLGCVLVQRQNKLAFARR